MGGYIYIYEKKVVGGIKKKISFMQDITYM